MTERWLPVPDWPYGLIVYTVKTDPNHLMGRQNGYASKVAWVDPRAVKAGAGNPSSDRGGIEFGGGIEVFPDSSAAQARDKELKSFTAPFGDGYDYPDGDAVLRLSQYLTRRRPPRTRPRLPGNAPSRWRRAGRSRIPGGASAPGTLTRGWP